MRHFLIYSGLSHLQMKKLLHYILFFILISCTILSCTDRSIHEKELFGEMDSLLESNPDSAYAQLKKIQSKIDSINDTGLSIRQLMYKTSAQNKLYLKMPSDTIFQSVVDYYAKYGTANDRMKSLYLMGCIYRDMHEAPQALKYYQEATESADTLSSDCDYHLLICIYGQIILLPNLRPVTLCC